MKIRSLHLTFVKPTDNLLQNYSCKALRENNRIPNEMGQNKHCNRPINTNKGSLSSEEKYTK